METITLHKFSQEEYWTQEYEKFNTLPRVNNNTNLFNVGTKKNPELLTYQYKKEHNNLSDEEWKKLCFSPFVDTQLRRITVVVVMWSYIRCYLSNQKLRESSLFFSKNT